MALLNTVTAPLWFVVVVGTGLFALTAYYREQKGAYSLMGIFGGAVLWAGGYAVELTTGAFAAHAVRFAGAGIVPVAIFLLSLQLTGRDELVTPRNVGGLFGILGVFFAVIVTNGMHGLWADPSTLANAGAGNGAVQWGPMFYVASTALLGVAVAALGLFVQQTLEQDTDSFITTSSVFVLLTAIPVVTYSVFILGQTALDLTPFTFVVSGLLMMFAMFYL